MFHFVRGESIGKGRMVDKGRDAEFRVVTGFVQSNMEGALLTWAGRQIPLEYANVSRIDAATGRQYALFGFNQFGSSLRVEEKVGIGPYAFSGPEERGEARILAVEALLAHMYRFVKGDWDVEGLRVISEGGREWKASDFGYHSSADISPGIR